MELTGLLEDSEYEVRIRSMNSQETKIELVRDSECPIIFEFITKKY